MRRSLRSVLGLLAVATATACAGARAADPAAVASPSRAVVRPAASAAVPASGLGVRAARTALAMVGAPYRYGGSSPRGFDCSGLVVYSYGRAGLAGLPRTAADLERASRRVALDELEPGDLLFFQLSGKKTSHVAIYVGDEAFVHAPSSGRRVERVHFDHVYWGPRLGRAGRL